MLEPEPLCTGSEIRSFSPVFAGIPRASQNESNIDKFNAHKKVG
jgi:hypothetical protein